MSPQTRVTREEWISGAIRFLAEGRAPVADVPMTDLYERLDVTKGSLYARFREGGVHEFVRDVITRWQTMRDIDQLGYDLQAILDPRERLRLLHARMLATARPDGALRRWAARQDHPAGVEAAREAVAQADAAITALVTTAMLDLGFTPDKATVRAGMHVHAFIGTYHTSAHLPPARSEEFEEQLAILTSAARE